MTKVPRWAFEKFPGADPTLTTHMKSVGEAMAIGRTFTEALQKALRSLEKPRRRSPGREPPGDRGRARAQRGAARATAGSHAVQQALRAGAIGRARSPRPPVSTLVLDQIALIDEVATERTRRPPTLTADLLRTAKRHGFSDTPARPAAATDARTAVRGARHALGMRPVYKTVDTCAAEFAATTPYHYSTYDEETEVAPRDRPAMIILGSGPEPDRSGHRVRLLLRARGVRAARGRVRDRDGQLQPRDGLDRLRHQRPAVLRAADPRGRPRGRATPRARPARSPA